MVASLQQTADAWSMQGRFADATHLLAARQAIRVLWTNLEKAAPPQAEDKQPDAA